MRQQGKYEFEGATRSVAEVMALLKEQRVVASIDKVRARLKKGQKTIAEIRRPLAKVNRAWNRYEARS